MAKKFATIGVASNITPLMEASIEVIEEYMNRVKPIIIENDDRIMYADGQKRYDNIKPVRTEPKIGRNDSCPCNSGKKYKHCCIKK